MDPGPFFGKKLLAFALQQQIARTRIDEHAQTSLALDKVLVDQLLIALQNRERIDPIFGRDIAHGRQRVAFVEQTVEYHGDDTIAKLAIDWLTVVPLTIHPVLHHCVSFSVIVDYNTISPGKLFLVFLCLAVKEDHGPRPGLKIGTGSCRVRIVPSK